MPTDLFPVAVYVLRDPETNAVRYVGISTQPESRLKRHLRESRSGNTKRKNWIRSLQKRGLVPKLEVIEDTANWDEAERRWIAHYRAQGCDLVNGTDGGNTVPSNLRIHVIRRNYPWIWRALHRVGMDIRGGKYWQPSPRVKAKLEFARFRINQEIKKGPERCQSLNDQIAFSMPYLCPHD